jgi:hypothetical protein
VFVVRHFVHFDGWAPKESHIKSEMPVDGISVDASAVITGFGITLVDLLLSQPDQE